MRIFFCTLLVILSVPFNISLHSQQYATQDLFIYDAIEIPDSSGTQYQDISPTIRNYILANPSDTITFSLGGRIVFSDSIIGRALELNLSIIPNIIVETGVFFDTLNNQYLCNLITADLLIQNETFGPSDILDLDLTSFFPNHINVGDTGFISGVFLQFLSSNIPQDENGLSLHEVLVYREMNSFTRILNYCIDSTFVYPVIVGQGSFWLRGFLKGVVVGSATVGGSLGGNVVGGVAAFLGTSAAMALANGAGDNSPDPPLPPPGPCCSCCPVPSPNLIPLDVGLRNFDVQINEDQIKLHWSVASELATDYYSVSKTLPNRQSREIGRIPRTNTDMYPKSYELIDAHPPIGMIKYVLIESDVDGNRILLDSVEVNWDKKYSYFVNPNPIDNEATIYFYSNLEEPRIIHLLNTGGQVVETWDWKNDPLKTETSRVYFEGISPGIYYLELITNRRRLRRKIAIIR